jgi:hypothetical protein
MAPAVVVVEFMPEGYTVFIFAQPLAQTFAGL